MSVARNILLFIIYTALAIAVAVEAPLRVPRLDQSVAVMIGLLIFLAGALVHEMYQRLSRESFLGRQILALRHAQSELYEQLNWSRRENKALAEAVQAVVRSGRLPSEPGTVDEAITEVRVIKSLGASQPRPDAQQKVVAEPAITLVADPDGFGPISARASAAHSTQGEQVLSSPLHSNPKAADAHVPVTKTSIEAGLKTAPNEKAGSEKTGNEKSTSEKTGAGDYILPEVIRNLSEDEILKQVQNALRDDRISFVLQPIVSLPQRKRRFYECFSRVRTEEDQMILPEEYIGVAEREGLITAIDNMLLFRCVQLVRKIQRRSDNLDFFCNISPHTLRDDDFFGDFVEFLESNDILGPNLIFEFAQSEFAAFGEVEMAHLERLARVGCRLSLDQVTDLRMDLPALAASNIRFVKIQADLLTAGTSEVDALLAAFRDVPVKLVAEKVEAEDTLRKLLDKQIDFGQGYLFGEPRLARPAA
ncbi:EAL domain-containing protein [Denitrobaculum tricleocarpae]|uniref:EAL domain-containing protein n=1 Tax=Denitrobaculum tricleocarpae TaxID=2591009 RepID=A0A545T7W3_9PROT|nr:EAL domain-containing protein [Denitrobaculum tricleocarpae]TQV73301.1 EAL domain-containing protein [Denitrobaculum tricleocarpae]